MKPLPPRPSARGSVSNPANRFEDQCFVPDPDAAQNFDPESDDAPSAPRTVFLNDDSQSIIAYNKSPDIGFGAGLNPYRGCEHGCAYCFARPTHEYLGFSAGLDFETKIMVKHQAPALLRAELARKSWQPQVIALSGVTDCYQPVERRLELTRRCLEVLADFRNPVAVITKNHLVTRDIDHLSVLAKYDAVSVSISVTTLDMELAKVLEPRASRPARRLAAIRELSAAGIPVRVLMGPVIPGLTDHEMPAIFAACAEAGAVDAGMVPLRLPWAVAPLFEAWLDRHAPGSKDKILGRVRDMRGGKLYDAQWGKRMTGEGFFADEMQSLFQLSRRRAGFPKPGPELSTAAFRVPGEVAQLELNL